jgi:hypothetical protein
MDTEHLQSVLAFGREQSGVEFKGPGRRTDRHFLARVVRAVLGMANRRDGGYVILGVVDSGGELTPEGLAEDELQTWTYDHVADSLATYADPSVQFSVTTPSIDSKTFVAIHVTEFGEVPVLCKKDYNREAIAVLREGALYVRSRRKPETIEVSTYSDMRDLVELATDKSLRRFMERAQSAGLLPSQNNSREDFAKQAATFSTARVDKIKSRGYWHVVISPDTFHNNRIASARELIPIVSQCRVEFGGNRWAFPHSSTENPSIGQDWIEASVEGGTHLEAWRLYQSGLFIAYLSVWDDWRDQSYFQEAPEDWKPGATLPVYDAIFTYLEVFEFAARLALTPLGADTTHISVTLSGMKDRILRMDNPQRHFYHDYTTTLEEYTYSADAPRDALVAQPQELAIRGTEELFSRFQWNPGADFIRGIQGEIGRT